MLLFTSIKSSCPLMNILRYKGLIEFHSWKDENIDSQIILEVSSEDRG